MFEAFAVLVGLKSFLVKESPVVPEPEFLPFRFPEATRESAPVPLAPRTLAELGVDSALAREMELHLQLLGHTQGDRIVGFSFRTPDGTSHALRLERAPAASAQGSAEKAA